MGMAGMGNTFGCSFPRGSQPLKQIPAFFDHTDAESQPSMLQI
jgi:hypothetical protein